MEVEVVNKRKSLCILQIMKSFNLCSNLFQHYSSITVIQFQIDNIFNRGRVICLLALFCSRGIHLEPHWNTCHGYGFIILTSYSEEKSLAD